MQTDHQFLADCKWEAFRGPGPGGQKRNKTSSAIRLTHEPSGLPATAKESRSQSQNKGRALRRLRHRVALELRCSLDVQAFRLPAEFKEGFAMSMRNENYAPFIGLVVDVLEAVECSVSKAAVVLCTSTGKLVAFLSRDEALLGHVNQRRAAKGLRGLNPG